MSHQHLFSLRSSSIYFKRLTIDDFGTIIRLLSQCEFGICSSRYSHFNLERSVLCQVKASFLVGFEEKEIAFLGFAWHDRNEPWSCFRLVREAKRNVLASIVSSDEIYVAYSPVNVVLAHIREVVENDVLGARLGTGQARGSDK